MRELLPVFGMSLILAGLSEYCSVKDTEHGGYVKKDKLFYGIMMIILAIFVGLRQGYNDTSAYIHAYEIMTTDITGIDWSIGNNPGFKLTNCLLKMLGFSTQDFLMFYAVITVFIYLWFVRKYTDNIFVSIFLFLTTGCYTFTMAAIKQCVAVAFCMIATDRAIQKRWGSYVFWIALACMFHPYSFMYFLIPFLKFNPWTGKTYGMLVIFAVVGVALEALLGSLIDITSMMGEEYTLETFTGEGVNILRVLVVWVPVALSFVAQRYLKYSDDEQTNILMNLTTLRAEIMFIALFGTANYFARLANYFCMFQLVTLPWLFKFYNDKSKRLLYILMFGCYVIYFYYSHAILYGGFDLLHKGIGLREYLITLF